MKRTIQGFFARLYHRFTNNHNVFKLDMKSVWQYNDIIILTKYLEARCLGNNIFVYTSKGEKLY